MIDTSAEYDCETEIEYARNHLVLWTQSDL